MENINPHLKHWKYLRGYTGYSRFRAECYSFDVGKLSCIGKYSQPEEWTVLCHKGTKKLVVIGEEQREGFYTIKYPVYEVIDTSNIKWSQSKKVAPIAEQYGKKVIQTRERLSSWEVNMGLKQPNVKTIIY